jgi:UDP-glucose:(heptosyl)LPS alpha-1,3-glucosyltransferase
MNLALCYPSVIPHQGGCETYIAGLARRLVGDGHAVHLYACRWDAAALPAGIDCHAVGLPRCPRFARAWLFSRACSSLLAGERHDVSIGFDKIEGVDVYYPQGGEYPASVRLSQEKHRNPVVRAGLRLARRFDPTHRSLLSLERRQLTRAGSLVLAISEMVRGHLLARGDVSPDTMRVLPIAPMEDRIREDDRPARRMRSRAEWGLDETHCVALFAAMNLRLKGIEPLLRAMARLRDTPLTVVVVGSEPDGALRRLARRLDLEGRVRFVGYCTDMRDAYFGADMLVHPTFYDPCANVVLEALACGLPVVTTRHNGAGEQMRGADPGGACEEGHLLADPHDDESLARVLRALIDPARRRACAGAARRAAARWTFDDHYRGLMAILREFHTGRSRNAAA